MEAAPPIENPSSKPGTRERWTSALPMFICFMLIALAPRIISKFDDMFREMDLGSLPFLTQVLFSLSSLIRTMPWLFTGFMFAVAWSYFAWIAEDRKRITWFNRVIVLLMALSVGALTIALFLPLIVTIDRIGK